MIGGAALASFGARALRIAGKVLTIGITLPVWAFLAFAVWWHFDKSSAVREAVTEFVAGEELAAERARAEALIRINSETRRRLAAAQRASRAFSERLAEANRQNQDLNDEISEMLGRPVAGDCTVDGALHDRLRNP